MFGITILVTYAKNIKHICHKQKGGNVLVLSRKKNEKIFLKVKGDEEIELTVVRIDNNKVRLGIQASENTTILRSELLDRDDAKIATT